MVLDLVFDLYFYLVFNPTVNPVPIPLVHLPLRHPIICSLPLSAASHSAFPSLHDPPLQVRSYRGAISSLREQAAALSSSGNPHFPATSPPSPSPSLSSSARVTFDFCLCAPLSLALKPARPIKVQEVLSTVLALQPRLHCTACSHCDSSACVSDFIKTPGVAPDDMAPGRCLNECLFPRSPSLILIHLEAPSLLVVTYDLCCAPLLCHAPLLAPSQVAACLSAALPLTSPPPQCTSSLPLPPPSGASPPPRAGDCPWPGLLAVGLPPPQRGGWLPAAALRGGGQLLRGGHCGGHVPAGGSRYCVAGDTCALPQMLAWRQERVAI